MCNVYIHSSLSEPFGFVIAEAMYNKIPIIATDTGLAADLIKHQKNGYIVNIEDENAIAGGVEFFIENNTNRMLENGKLAIEESFGTDVMWRKHFELYDQLINEKRF